VRRHERAGERVPVTQPHPVEVPHDDAIGLEQPGLGVGDAVLGAVGADERLRPAQVAARHAREQVVLDLQVEAAHEPVDRPAAADVARGQDLAGEEVDPRVPRDQRHPLVVGGEGRAHVDAEAGELHGEDGCTQARPEQGEDQAREHGQPDRQEHGLGTAVAELAVLDDGADRVGVQAEALEGEQGKEEPPLASGEPAAQAPAPGDVVGGEEQDAGPDVLVRPDLVGVGVVAGVLAHPPAVTQAHDQGGDQARGPSLAAPVTKICRGQWRGGGSSWCGAGRGSGLVLPAPGLEP